MFTQQSSRGRVIPCVVDGHSVVLAESQNFPVVQGKSGETVHYAQSATCEVAINAAESAARVFQTWRDTPARTRRDIINKAADILVKRSEEVANRCSLETSCTEEYAIFDGSLAAGLMRQNASTAVTVCGKVPPSDQPQNVSLVYKEPVGVVFAIAP